jgi:PQQ-dependent dehydrogenase (methanol/ethanol family)
VFLQAPKRGSYQVRNSGYGWLILSACFSGVACGAGEPQSARATKPASEWPILGGSSDVQHYSPLSQINDHNVQQLGLAWRAEIPSKDGLVGNPLVADGVVFQSGPVGRIYANDVHTGRLLWTFAPQMSFGAGSSLDKYWSSRINRGLALYGDNVYVASGDCRLFAVDRKTGKKVWEVVSCDSTKYYGITGAPRVGDGKIFIGNNCADSGTERGYVDAFDAKTGARAWRFYTMPPEPGQPYENAAMAMAAKTWGTDWSKVTHGCVSPYDAMTYDSKLNLLYIGTGSPGPWSPSARAKDAGDELFSDSIVAVNASTGAYVWHYQTTQHDGWDADATMHIMIAELPLNGVTRRVVMTAPKNGFFYVLDAKTGHFLSANNYVPVNWASRIDQKTGRPVPKPDAMWWLHPDEKVVVSPGPIGAHNWLAMAYNPATQLVYVPAIFAPVTMKAAAGSATGGVSWDPYYGSSGDPKWKSGGRLIAWDPIHQRARWTVDRPLAINGGVLSTGGNLVFEGTAQGTFDAFAADTGRLLWSFDAHGTIHSAPTTLEIDGEQFILVASGNAGSMSLGQITSRYATTPESRSPARLLAFKLGGTAIVPPTVVAPIPKPPRAPSPAALAAQGRGLYEASGCSACHGQDVESPGSSIPDLRRASADTHDKIAAIVLDGLYHELGMPAFRELGLSDSDLAAIQAYIISEAWSAYNKQEASKGAAPR